MVANLLTMQRKANLRDEEKKSAGNTSFEDLDTAVPEATYSSTFSYMTNNSHIRI